MPKPRAHETLTTTDCERWADKQLRALCRATKTWPPRRTPDMAIAASKYLMEKRDVIQSSPLVKSAVNQRLRNILAVSRPFQPGWVRVSDPDLVSLTLREVRATATDPHASAAPRRAARTERVRVSAHLSLTAEVWYTVAEPRELSGPMPRDFGPEMRALPVEVAAPILLERSAGGFGGEPQIEDDIR